MKAKSILFLAFFVALVVLPDTLSGQGGLADPGAMASQNLRGYTHMFIAYFIAWAVILGWVISLSRRLGRVESSLKE